MTNSEVMQFIINKLENSSNITWKNDKELFELIFAPILYGNEIENRQREAKRPILNIFQNIENFYKIKFYKLVKDIICGDDEQRCREEVIAFLQEEITKLKITTDADIEKLVANIPCKHAKEKNYRIQFVTWKRNKIAIYDKNIKNALQKNFNFESDLWSMEDAKIKQILKKISLPPKPIIDPHLTQKELNK